LIQNQPPIYEQYINRVWLHVYIYSNDLELFQCMHRLVIDWNFSIYKWICTWVAGKPSRGKTSDGRQIVLCCCPNPIYRRAMSFFKILVGSPLYMGWLYVANTW
jgi:hypothetical protein